MSFNALNKRSHSLWSMGIITLVFIGTFYAFGLWKTNRITLDVPSYYTYLPSVFIYQDLQLKYIDKNPAFFRDKIWFYTLPGGKRIIKHSMGVSVALSPFFLIGHTAAYLSGAPQDGYSFPYQNAMSLGVLLYLLTGLFFLRKILLNFFSEKVIALTFLSLVIGTNLFWYITFEGLMTHGVGFSLLCICMYVNFRWLEKGGNKYLLFFSVAFGLLLLIRPLALTLLVYFFIACVISKGGIRNFILFIAPDKAVIFLAAVCMLLIFSPQLFYWKYITGHWYFDTYMDEHFLFSSPQMIPFLFSFRKGWFVYSPILLFSVLGLIRLFKIHRALFYATLFSVLLSVYVFSSWWAWSYGICWGMRPMIDSYALLSFPMAAAFTFILSRGRIFSVLLYGSLALFTALNLFQTWQYKNGLIHFDDMTKESYFKGFFQTKASLEWYDCLRPFDWERRKNGLPQLEYSKEYVDSITVHDTVYFRGYNLKFLSASGLSQYVLTGNFDQVTSDELFYIQPIRGDTVAILSDAGKFLSVKPERRSILIADADSPGFSERFIRKQVQEDDNKISLKACNGKYLSVNPQFPNIVQATASEVSTTEIFRLFLLKRSGGQQ